MVVPPSRTICTHCLETVEEIIKLDLYRGQIGGKVCVGTIDNECNRFQNQKGGPNNDEHLLGYLYQLVEEKKRMDPMPTFQHATELLAKEINYVQSLLFKSTFVANMKLPPAEGDIVYDVRKIYIPIHEFPTFNFIGRIIGPGGKTCKQLQSAYGCSLRIRGSGSMKDFEKECRYRNHPSFSHLNEHQHVLLECWDTPKRCELKMEAASQWIYRLLVPDFQGADELKRRQLAELSLMNGTYQALLPQNLINHKEGAKTISKKTTARSQITYAIEENNKLDMLFGGSPPWFNGLLASPNWQATPNVDMMEAMASVYSPFAKM